MDQTAALTISIELYLYDRPRWVPVAEICERFGIGERDLRATNKRRPLCARFAISSPTPGANGFEHIARARRDYEAALRASLDFTLAPATDLHGQAILPL